MEAAAATLCGDASVQLCNGAKGSENLGDDLLEDLDSYLEDLNDRLTISRMVSDSVIKGIVSAVEQEASERIAEKELEMVGLKETLHLYCVGEDKNGSLGFQVPSHKRTSVKQGLPLSFSGTLEEHDRMRQSLNSLRIAAKGQFKNLKKEIDQMRGCSSIKRISSNSELVGLGGILDEKVSGKWMDVDRALQNLKTTLDAVYKQVDDMVYMSKASLSEWQQEKEFQGEVEAMVIRNSICSLQEEFEEKLWDQNAQFCGIQIVSWLEKFNEISSLRQELDTISKLLSSPEIGHLISHGYESSEEWNNAKRTDHFHRKVSGSLWEGNGKHGDSKITLPENLESSQLKHMSKEELFKYFKAEMTKMKRNHESQVQEMTEEYFILKRELFKEREASLLLRKDKEFDVLKKKIPQVISKLEYVLLENEKLPSGCSKGESLGGLKDRLDALLSENRKLRDLLTDKKKEVKCLTMLVSDAAEKKSKHSLAEANYSKMIGNFKCAIEDAHIEAFVSDEVYKCVLREVTGQIRCDTEQSDLESVIMQDICGIIFREAVHDAEAAVECGIGDSDMQSMIMQELCKIIFREAFKDAAAEVNILKTKYVSENDLRMSLEGKVLEVERALKSENEEKERLKQEMLLMALSMEEKDKSELEIVTALQKEKEQFDLTSQELHRLREQVSQQQMLISDGSKESDLMKSKLVEALVKIDLYEGEISTLNQKLDLTLEEFRETDEKRRVLLGVVQEKQNILALAKTEDCDNRKKLESIITLAHGLLKAIADLECRVMETIKRNSFRLEDSTSQLSSLIQRAIVLRRTGVLYKQRLEKRCSDLQKAEAEVDLLGDEADALLSLLEKIYIALDHYSPILQHYSGIMEILKLIRRELSGESIKQV
ncbi:WPP domain-associated protein [Malania oleifera]|uniref:WPP domain-associated protein n=1 Tax=Malania oleifera TaxID=397392 RepID=UPI0025ADF34C|nr:WPP domain-associated protein [Malania oleifera]XP_057971932.1 WPP domain-associated protein [Malania oleifera]XP_057971933.1 WPP domain-associated protein [Malania oleifera]XP_057971934.1 WPP domain-associated protein [Malania oleifera]